MQRKTFAIGTTVLALAFPASAAAGDTQVGSQSNTTKQSASSKASADTGPVVIIGNKNMVSGARRTRPSRTATSPRSTSTRARTGTATRSRSDQQDQAERELHGQSQHWPGRDHRRQEQGHRGLRVL